MSNPPPASAPPPDGKYLGWLTAVKGLTLTNALVIIMLVMAAVPAYLVYRAVNDETLLDRFMSSYREITGQQSGCTVRTARQKGGPATWSVSTGFAYEGSDRYVVSVFIDHEPDMKEVESYCATLNLIVDFMRDREGESPVFPGTNRPVIRQYKRDR